MNRQDFISKGGRGSFLFGGFREKYAFDIPIGRVSDFGIPFSIENTSRERQIGIITFMGLLRNKITTNYIGVRLFGFDYSKTAEDGGRLYTSYFEGVCVEEEIAKPFNPMPLQEYIVNKGDERLSYGYSNVDKKLFSDI